jgi:hypothetical protein
MKMERSSQKLSVFIFIIFVLVLPLLHTFIEEIQAISVPIFRVCYGSSHTLAVSLWALWLGIQIGNRKTEGFDRRYKNKCIALGVICSILDIILVTLFGMMELWYSFMNLSLYIIIFYICYLLYASIFISMGILLSKKDLNLDGWKSAVLASVGLILLLGGTLVKNIHWNNFDNVHIVSALVDLANLIPIAAILIAAFSWAKSAQWNKLLQKFPRFFGFIGFTTPFIFPLFCINHNMLQRWIFCLVILLIAYLIKNGRQRV